MKRFMMVMALVFAFACGICGKEIVNEVKRQNDEKFVVKTTYRDEIVPNAEHKVMNNRTDNGIILDMDEGIYATCEVVRSKGVLCYTVWKYGEEKPLGRVDFWREYRAADDQSRVTVVKNGIEKSTVCYTGNLFRNVVMTELKNLV